MPDPTRDAFNDMVKGFIEDASYGEPAEARLFAEAMAALDALIAAARADGATAERARLAGMASEGDREMVEAFGLAVFAVAVATERRNFDMAIAEKSGAAKVTLLARLAAARGEAVEDAARVAESWPSATYGPHAGPTTRTVAERIAACIRILALPRDGTGVG